ncbi:MAG TPA: hypothetical protein VKB34_04250, partial [Povalibacter sp.]|nr:hypothetical protein [Povalibacter sp.]
MSRTPGQRRIGLAAAAAALASVFASQFSGHVVGPEKGVLPANAEQPRAAVSSAPSVTSTSATQVAKPALDPAASTSDAAEADISLEQYATDKYRSLFTGSFLRDGVSEDLRAALLEREHVAVAVNTARQSQDEVAKDDLPRLEQTLAAADERIRSLLHPTDYARYEALRDSDIEQFQLDDYAGGISNIAPLDAADREAILRTKL